MAKLEVNVTVEKTLVHDLIKEFAKSVFDQHGIRIDSVSIEWIDVSVMSKKDFIVKETRAITAGF